MKESTFWNEKFNQIESLIKYDNLANFLNWPPIIECMFVNYNTFTQHWIKCIEDHPRWKRLLDLESSKGNPQRSKVYNNCSDNQIAQVFHWMSLVNQTNFEVSQISNIVEIGAGYGLLSQTIFNDGFKGKYHIFDKPIMHVIQQFYLENPNINYITDFDFFNQKLENCLLIANWSLSEMPIEVREKILNSELFSNCKHYLICFQYDFEGNNNISYFSKYFQKIENIPFLPENFRVIV